MQYNITWYMKTKETVLEELTTIWVAKIKKQSPNLKQYKLDYWQRWQQKQHMKLNLVYEYSLLTIKQVFIFGENLNKYVD